MSIEDRYRVLLSIEGSAFDPQLPFEQPDGWFDMVDFFQSREEDIEWRRRTLPGR